VVGLPSKDAKPVLGKGKIKLGWSISKVKERDSQPFGTKKSFDIIISNVHCSRFDIKNTKSILLLI